MDWISLHGAITTPTTAVVRPAVRKLNLVGERFSNAFVGATMLAAMLVERVARRSPVRESAVGMRPGILPARRGLVFDIDDLCHCTKGPRLGIQPPDSL